MRAEIEKEAPMTKMPEQKEGMHTALPWTLHLHSEALGDDVAHISGPHGCAFIMVHAGCENINPGREHKVSNGEARASAQYLHKAVNAYPSLLKENEELRAENERLRSFFSNTVKRVFTAADIIDEHYRKFREVSPGGIAAALDQAGLLFDESIHSRTALKDRP